MDWTINFLGMPSYPLGIMDLVSIAILVVGSISGLIVGFIKSAGKQLSWVLSFPIALIFTSLLAKFLKNMSGWGIFLCSLLAFMILSVVAFHLINLISLAISKALDKAGLKGVNRLLGFIWGIIVSGIVIAFIYGILIIIPGDFFDPLLDNSAIYRLFAPHFESASEIMTEALNSLGF